MTPKQEELCAKIIHGHAMAAGGANAVPVPGLGIAVDMITMTTMSVALARVFNKDIQDSIAYSTAICALKNTVLKQPIKIIQKEISKLIPVLGNIVGAGISAGMIEATGWAIVEQYKNDQSFSHPKKNPINVTPIRKDKKHEKYHAA